MLKFGKKKWQEFETEINLNNTYNYSRHHNQLLIRNRSWILTIYKNRIFWKKLFENKVTVFNNVIKDIQTASYNGTHTVYIFWLKSDIEAHSASVDYG